MKKTFFILLTISFLAACNNPDTKAPSLPIAEADKALTDSANYTSIQWIDSIHRDLGKITEGEQLEVSFRFKNTGTKPLVIANVHASCGCTVPETPKEPFAPGAEGLIKAKFNSNNRVGPNHKQVYVTANTTPSITQQLEFTVEVEKKANN